MPTLLLEIGCEELPASACREADAQLPELCRRHLGVEPTRLFIGPRRLGFLVEDLPERAPDERRRGPAERIAFDEEGRPTKAAEGFARGQGLSVEGLERSEGHVWAHIPGRPLAESLPERLEQVVRGLAFGKSMRWDDGGLRFARPVRWLCAMLDRDVVPFEVAGLRAGAKTYGHRFTYGAVELGTAQAYAPALRQAEVEPDAEARRAAIVKALPEGWGDPLGKLDEVVHLVEKPVVLEGSFDERFLELPAAVIVTAMQSHQRYFPLGGNRFALVANGGDPDVVRAGNERVLEGRLEDAAFTLERDLGVGLEGLAGRLGSITFFAGAGSYADKTARLIALVEELGGDEEAREAARLSKVDQAAELVREFPDLQGTIGAEYARRAGASEAISGAIEEQYLPEGAGGRLPETPAGKLLAVADRIDTLNTSFGLGHRPTGSRDPFGLRRAAIALCRLSTEGDVTVPMRLLDDEVASFVEERFEGQLDVPVEFVRAARRAPVEDLGSVARLAEALGRLEDDQLGSIHTAYVRASRLAEKGNGVGELDPALLVEPAEVEVVRAVERAAPEIRSALDDDDFGRAVTAAAELGQPLDRFFEEVLVLAEDEGLRANRLRLLADVRDTVGLLGDLSQIPR